MLKKIYQSQKIREWRQLAVFALLLFAGRSAIADWNRIPSGSMEPSIYVGDLVFVNKLAYDLKIPFTTKHLAKWSNPKQGDIVVFYGPNDHRRLIKRVIGTPGDLIEMEHNALKINGKPIAYELNRQPLENSILFDEQYDAVIAEEHLTRKTHKVMALPQKPAMRSFKPIRVPQGQYFMMGDNRDDSLDSRYFGFVTRDQILGKAEGVIVSWDKERLYKPRVQRFFQRLV